MAHIFGDPPRQKAVAQTVSTSLTLLTPSPLQADKPRDSLVSCQTAGNRLSIASVNTRMSSEDLELMEIERQRRLKQQELMKNQSYFEKVQTKLSQEKIDQAQKEYQQLLEHAA